MSGTLVLNTTIVNVRCRIMAPGRLRPAGRALSGTGRVTGRANTGVIMAGSVGRNIGNVSIVCTSI